MPASIQPEIVFDGHAAIGGGAGIGDRQHRLMWLDIPDAMGAVWSGRRFHPVGPAFAGPNRGCAQPGQRLGVGFGGDCDGGDARVKIVKGLPASSW